ncbi:plasmid mobilization relaxosome protein MobC [Streptomyces cathayae]|uniref:Plasmid mobilization relaxosome protein MobC n=1 Tax=Streptomyces cathayae TaxID=3031124 RepID=A0ABY8K0F7_9ACTN|nr:plasmid mobilization relaxosome protein MobC [Streptomyces sp. HUAS 5]WGD41630.1 plasmid mobilization relaxosome protein MobC [Streptomyces sp. HUAS 5]
MHTPHHHDPTTHEDLLPTTPAPGGASWRSGHSPAGGALEPDPAPGVAGPVRHQGAPDGKAATEGGPQPGRAGRTARAGKGKSRPRDKKQRPAHSVRLNDHELAIIRSGAEHVGMSVAGFLAYSALAAARDQSRTAAAIATERDVLTALFGVRRQLGWAGSNVNQIAKALNSGADAPHFAAALDGLRRAAQAVQRAADRITNRREDQAA